MTTAETLISKSEIAAKLKARLKQQQITEGSLIKNPTTGHCYHLAKQILYPNQDSAVRYFECENIKTKSVFMCRMICLQRANKNKSHK